MCRSSTDECDLPEYCNGSSSLCQSDVFVQVRAEPCSTVLDRVACSLFFCGGFRTVSPAGASRPTVTTGSVVTTTASVRTSLAPVRTVSR